MILAEENKTAVWNSIESPKINPHIYGQLIFDKEASNTQWRKESLLNKWCWENLKATCKRMKLDCHLAPYIKINSKWVKDLNIRSETIKHIEENIVTKLMDLASDGFL